MMAEPRPGGRHAVPDDPPRRQSRTIDAAAVEIPIAMAAGVTPDGGSPDAGKAGFLGAGTVTPAGRRSGRSGPTRIIAASLAAAVVLVAAAALWLTVSRFRGDLDEIMTRMAAIEAQQGDTAAVVAAQEERLDRQSRQFEQFGSRSVAPPSVAEPDSKSAARLAAIEAELKPFTARLDDLERRLGEVAGAVQRYGERSRAVAGESSDKAGGTPAAPVERSIAALAARIDSLEAVLKSTRELAAASTEAVSAADAPLRAAIVAEAMHVAVERGYPFATELAAARSIGLDPGALALLEPFAASGVPSQVETFRQLSALVPELLRVAAPAADSASPGSAGSGRSGTYFDRLQAGAEKLVRIRPVGDAPADDPAAMIGRIELAMTHRDLAAVVAELDRLPAPASALAEAWRKKAFARQAAIDTARRMAASSLAELADAPPPTSQR